MFSSLVKPVVASTAEIQKVAQSFFGWRAFRFTSFISTSTRRWSTRSCSGSQCWAHKCWRVLEELAGRRAFRFLRRAVTPVDHIRIPADLLNYALGLWEATLAMMTTPQIGAPTIPSEADGLKHSLALARCFGLGQRRERRPVQHRAVRRELRAVAGAIPALLGRIPVHMAAEMGADRRPRHAACRPCRGRPRAVLRPSRRIPPSPGLSSSTRVELARQQILGEILHRRHVLADVSPRCRSRGLRDGS